MSPFKGLERGRWVQPSMVEQAPNPDPHTQRPRPSVPPKTKEKLSRCSKCQVEAVAEESGVQDPLGLRGEFKASQLQEILSQPEDAWLSEPR